MTIADITQSERDILLALLDRERANHKVKHLIGGNPLEAEALRQLDGIRSKVQNAVTYV